MKNGSENGEAVEKMEKNIKDYLHLYFGSNYRLIWKHGNIRRKLRNPGIISSTTIYNIYKALETPNYYSFQILLRPLTNMNDEEFRWLEDKTHYHPGGSHWESDITHKWKEEMIEEINEHGNAQIFFYLLSKHFDLFGLIEAGLAIDKTKL